MNLDSLLARARAAVAARTDFPVWTTATVLWERLVRDRLALTASSLTYTTLLSLVPLFTVVLSLFTIFPMFDRMEGALQQWLLESLIPADISESVMSNLTQFANNASQLGIIGIVGFVAVALMLILTIDSTLNEIWQVREKRTLGQRVLVYWAALTLGPLVMASSLVITSYAVTTSQGWIPELSTRTDFLLGLLQFCLMTGGLTFLYRFVPNAPVLWKHALAGAFFAALAIGIAKWGLGIYLSRNTTYSHIYGAFAVLPILLLWIYISWLVVLFGAVIAAYLPSIVGGVARLTYAPGSRFALALDLIAALAAARTENARGLTLPHLARTLRIDGVQVNSALATLQTMNWVGRLTTMSENEEPRYVLLVDPQRQAVRPLVERFLVGRDSALLPAWEDRPLRELHVADVIASHMAPDADGASG